MGTGPRTSTVVNVPFQLHYKLTGFILVAFSSVLVFHHIFRPGPIRCAGSDYIPNDFITSTCHDGLSTTLRGDSKNPEEGRIYQGFYPYVWLFFLCQAACLCVPRVLWNIFEGGRVEQLAGVLGNPNLRDGGDALRRVSAHVAANFRTNDVYPLGLFLCELLNFVNALLQVHALDWFVRGRLWTSGDRASDSGAPLADLFPSSVKCTFQRIGPSGLPQRHDAACILPLNRLHSTMCHALVFWFGALAVVGGLVLLYRLVWLCWRKLRYATLLKHYRRASCQRLLDANVDKFGFGDYFLMSVILENAHPANRHEFLRLVHGCKLDIEDGHPTFELRERNEASLSNIA